MTTNETAENLTNFLEETIYELDIAGFSTDDVELIYTTTGLHCGWHDFCNLGDFVYEKFDVDCEIIAGNLIIKLTNDQGYLFREVDRGDHVVDWMYLPTPQRAGVDLTNPDSKLRNIRTPFIQNGGMS